jgi:hypothetical protein
MSGVDFMKLYFGRKVFGANFCLQAFKHFHSKTADKCASDNFGLNFTEPKASEKNNI